MKFLDKWGFKKYLNLLYNSYNLNTLGHGIVQMNGFFGLSDKGGFTHSSVA